MLFFRVLIVLSFMLSAAAFELSTAHAHAIGNKIFRNECGNNPDAITFWKQGEEFASMGIAHFIWFPSTYNGPFTQRFPALLTFMRQQGARVPDWLLQDAACPWQTREEFYQHFNDPKMVELRTFLQNTFDLQTQCIIQLAQHSLEKIMHTLTAHEKKLIQHQLNRLQNSTNGLYAIIDYLNFKGDGTSPKERYCGQGWGLLQVLETMKGTAPGKKAVEEFVASAKKILTQRVHNAPPERNEQQWLKGWKNRLDTYLIF